MYETQILFSDKMATTWDKDYLKVIVLMSDYK